MKFIAKVVSKLLEQIRKLEREQIVIAVEERNVSTKMVKYLAEDITLVPPDDLLENQMSSMKLAQDSILCQFFRLVQKDNSFK